ncbi:MAG: NAD(P) transhydrogenase subunit beta [Myxococcales bacterium]
MSPDFTQQVPDVAAAAQTVSSTGDLKTALINIAYLVAAVLFILGLKGLAHPRTAVRANLKGALGMLIAVVATLVDAKIIGFTYIVAGVVLGGSVGWILAVRVPMTSMPEMVALLNGFGGIASIFVAAGSLLEANYLASHGQGAALSTSSLVAVSLTGLVGAVTFFGSLMAFAKLREYKWTWKLKQFPGQQAINATLAAGAVVLGVLLVSDPTLEIAYWGIVAVGSVLGITLVMSIGGADMPVVVALLNSYSGIAAALSGFAFEPNNNVLIIAGSLVGASGIILTQIMCKAMNRSLTNVLFGVMGPTSATPKADDVYAGKIKATSPDEIAMLFDGAQRVVVVPGYGMAVAQAQHAVRDLATLLESRGTTVEFAIHPVAGRMPGHMNVLLAEADIDYSKLLEMDEINPTMSEVDVAIVLGANDVVNPVARTDPKSPIAGMPIIDVDKARTVVVVKRSLSPGFAGIPNPLFAMDNTLMFFADGKKAILDILAATKEAG